MRRYSTLTATNSLNVTPGVFTTNVIAQADTLNPNNPYEITITLIKYEETTVISSKTTGITPEEFKNGTVNINFEREINTVEQFTGTVPFRVTNLGVTKNVEFTNGIGILNLTGTMGIEDVQSINTEFDIYNFTQTFNIDKVDGVFKSPKYLKD